MKIVIPKDVFDYIAWPIQRFNNEMNLEYGVWLVGGPLLRSLLSTNISRQLFPVKTIVWFPSQSPAFWNVTVSIYTNVFVS